MKGEGRKISKDTTTRKRTKGKRKLGKEKTKGIS